MSDLSSGDFARPDQQEESEFGTNLDQLRANLALTPEERFLKYARREPGMRILMEAAARWRASKYSDAFTRRDSPTS